MATPRPSDVLLHVGGRALRRYGSLLRRRFQKEDAFIFARTSIGTAIGADGMVHTFAYGEPRIEWVDLDGDGIRETPGILLEGAHTNACLRSEQLDDTAWTADGTTVTPNATTAPDGTVTMDKLVETAAAGLHQRYQPFTITDSEYVAVSAFVKAAERSKLRFIFVDGATGNFFGGLIDTVAKTITSAQSGTATQTGQTIEEMLPTFPGVFRVRCVGRLATGVTAARLYCGLRDGTGLTSYTGDGASGAHYWGVQMEHLGTGGGIGALSYVRTTGAAMACAADVFDLVFGHGPQQNVTSLLRIARPMWADLTGDIGVFPGFWMLSKDVNPRFYNYFDRTTRLASSLIRTTAGDSVRTVAIPAGAEIRVLSQFRNLDTDPETAIDVGSGLGAFSTGAASPFTSFGTQRLTLRGDGDPYGNLLELIVARGLFTKAEMEAY